mmetsp:Transcript_55653/g.156703  ORF Transcript_55653/g.156703 Transcript_55653/m.156703 type:complete len:224 (-) Transcript_55653:32-703(-)
MSARLFTSGSAWMAARCFWMKQKMAGGGFFWTDLVCDDESFLVCDDESRIFNCLRGLRSCCLASAGAACCPSATAATAATALSGGTASSSRCAWHEGGSSCPTASPAASPVGAPAGGAPAGGSPPENVTKLPSTRPHDPAVAAGSRTPLPSAHIRRRALAPTPSPRKVAYVFASRARGWLVRMRKICGLWLPSALTAVIRRMPASAGAAAASCPRSISPALDF